MQLIYNFLSTFKNNFIKKKYSFEIYFNKDIVKILKIFLRKGYIYNFKKISSYKIKIFLNFNLSNKIKFDFSIHNFFKYSNINKHKKNILCLICINNKKEFKIYLNVNSMNSSSFSPFIYIYG